MLWTHILRINSVFKGINPRDAIPYMDRRMIGRIRDQDETVWSKRIKENVFGVF